MGNSVLAELLRGKGGFAIRLLRPRTIDAALLRKHVVFKCPHAPMSIAQFFSRPGGATCDTKRQKTTEEEDVPPEEPRTIVVWNANSLLSRVDSNRNELRAFIEKNSPDVLFVSEVRMPAAGPPGSKVGDGKRRTHGTLSKATAALAEEVELGLHKCRPGGATAAR